MSDNWRNKETRSFLPPLYIFVEGGKLVIFTLILCDTWWCFFFSLNHRKKNIFVLFFCRCQNADVTKTKLSRESAPSRSQSEYIVSWYTFSILCCSAHLKSPSSVFFFPPPSPSGAIMKLAVPHRPERNMGRNITFCREESLSRTPVTEFISTWTTIHLDREVINLIGFCLLTQWIPWPWLSSAGPEMLRSSPWRRHLNVPELLRCSSEGTLMYRWRYLLYSWCFVTPFGAGGRWFPYLHKIHPSQCVHGLVLHQLHPGLAPKQMQTFDFMLVSVLSKWFFFNHSVSNEHCKC